MKLVWLPITAALLTSQMTLAETNQPSQIGNKDLSPNKVNEIYADRDLDGSLTKNDQCQNSLLNSMVNTIGCDLDTDQDGIFDRNDQCPSTPAGRKVNFLGCEADSDNDGVVDSIDRCPLTPLGTRVDANGCKIIGDSDNDGVTDNVDQCPNTPAGVEVNQFGCQPRTSLLVNIVFDTASWEIRPDQEAFLMEDLSTLKDLQEDEVVLIVGHTDSVGRDAANMRLSWNRAASVKQYLMSHSGVESAQIYLVGQGESAPVADNSTSVGRQQNRRIELKVMIHDSLPQNAVLQLPQE